MTSCAAWGKTSLISAAWDLKTSFIDENEREANKDSCGGAPWFPESRKPKF